MDKSSRQLQGEHNLVEGRGFLAFLDLPDERVGDMRQLGGLAQRRISLVTLPYRNILTGTPSFAACFPSSIVILSYNTMIDGGSA